MTADLRRRIMRANGPRDTGPELALRRRLHRLGLRYRIADRTLPGSPDLSFPKWHAVVFVNGCYWHHHPGCRRATVPKTNTDFWLAKFRANGQRDRRKVVELLAMGWRVGVVWECSDMDAAVGSVARFVRSRERTYEEWPDPRSRGGLGLFEGTALLR